jgi:hypothetical protein
MDFKPNFKAAKAAEPKVAEAVDVPWKTEAEDDDTLSFFKKLAEDD